MALQRQTPKQAEQLALPDATIVRAAAGGDRSARALLVEGYADYAYGLAFRLSWRRGEAEEILRDAFVEVLRALPSLRDAEAFPSWLGRIVVNMTRRHIRTKRLRRLLGLAAPEPLDVHPLVAPGAPPDVLADTESLYRALDALPAWPRLALSMRHVEERGLDEIGELLGGSRASVKRWLDKAESHLRRRLGAPPPRRRGTKRRP